MRSTNIAVMATTMLMFAALHCDARASIKSETVANISPSQIKAAMDLQSADESVEQNPEAGPSHWKLSDGSMMLIAGIAMVVLQLRRQQKVSSETRITGAQYFSRFNNSVFGETPQKSQAQPRIDSGLMIHPERG